MLDAKVRKTRGAIMLSALPNTLVHHRLGVAVGTRVGSAVVRSRCKRLLREAFRLEHQSLPASPTGGYDLVVGLRAQGKPLKRAPIDLADCRSVLVELAHECDRVWRKRARTTRDQSSRE